MYPPCVYCCLDFDGVLHHQFAGPARDDVFEETQGLPTFLMQLEARFPSVIDEPYFDADGHLFDREYFLVDLLQKHSNLKVVISTSWRNKIPLEYLKNCLSAPVRARVVGVLEASDKEQCDEGVRGQLMVQWLARRGESKAQWIALDDQPRHYTLHPNRVVKTPWRGLDAVAVDAAVFKIRQF